MERLILNHFQKTILIDFVSNAGLWVLMLWKVSKEIKINFKWKNSSLSFSDSRIRILNCIFNVSIFFHSGFLLTIRTWIAFCFFLFFNKKKVILSNFSSNSNSQRIKFSSHLYVSYRKNTLNKYLLNNSKKSEHRIWMWSHTCWSYRSDSFHRTIRE